MSSFFPCAQKKRSSNGPFLIFLCKLNFSLDVSWMLHEKLKLSEERASFPCDGREESRWQGWKCIQASKLQLHGGKAYRSRLFNSCYVKKFSRKIHWELAEASLKKMKSSWRGFGVGVRSPPCWSFICKANNEKNRAVDSKNQLRTLTHGWKRRIRNCSRTERNANECDLLRQIVARIGQRIVRCTGRCLDEEKLQNAYTNAMRKHKIEK